MQHALKIIIWLLSKFTRETKRKCWNRLHTIVRKPVLQYVAMVSIMHCAYVFLIFLLSRIIVSITLFSHWSAHQWSRSSGAPGQPTAADVTWCNCPFPIAWYGWKINLLADTGCLPVSWVSHTLFLREDRTPLDMIDVHFQKGPQMRALNPKHVFILSPKSVWHHKAQRL